MPNDTEAVDAVERKFVPQETPVTAPYWAGLRLGELRLQRCKSCARVIFYPRLFCPSCGGQDIEWFKASGRGVLHSYVINHLAAPGWEAEVPYVIAIVKLEEGPTMMSNLVGVEPEPGSLTLDMPLRMLTRVRGNMMLPHFAPLDAKDLA